MKLYHYSKEKHLVLQTRLKRGDYDSEELKKQKEFEKQVDGVGVYVSHISFFFDPLPLVLLAKIFGHGHHSWVDGNELYEHIVDVDSLDNKTTYFVTETPSAVKMLDETDWVDSDEFLIAYKKKTNAIIRQTGELGHTLIGLKNQIAIYEGKTEYYYLLASKRHDFKKNFNMYAASVPHVMLFPMTGEIKVSSINKVVVGSDNRKPLTIANESMLPTWSKW